MLTIAPASPGAVCELSDALHPDDAAELQAALVPDLSDALADVPMLELRNAEGLVALFGVQKIGPRAGVPWMLCTKLLDRVPRHEMAQISRSVVAEWMDSHDSLTNLVHRHNQRAIKFVQFLGFEVDTIPVGPGRDFYRFEWSRACATQ